MAGTATELAATPTPVLSKEAASALDRSLVKGIAWTGAVKWGGQAFAWVSTVIVARLLTPVDYGIVAMATVFVGLITIFSEFGIGSAVVVMRDLKKEQVNQLHTLSVLLGFLTFALSCAAAIPISNFFRTPELVAVVIVMASGFVIAGFRTVPDALLQKDLQFRTLAGLDAVQLLLVPLLTVALAIAGFRYWTLVISNLIGALVVTIFAVSRRPQLFIRPRIHEIRSALNLGHQMLVQRLAWYVYSNADFLTVGRLLGQAALGNYGTAWSLASVPVGKVSSLVLRVTPAYFSSIQNDKAAVRRYLVSLTEGVALVTFPIAVGLSLVAHDFVLGVLGEKWALAIVPIQFLGVYSCLRSISPLLAQVLSITGEARFAMRNAVMAAFILPLAFVAASRWGIIGVATSWLIVHPVMILPLYQRVRSTLELSHATYARALWPAVSSCMLMALAVFGAKTAMGDGSTPIVRLVIATLVGAGVYLLSIRVLHAGRVKVFRQLIGR